MDKSIKLICILKALLLFRSLKVDACFVLVYVKLACVSKKKIVEVLKFYFSTTFFDELKNLEIIVIVSLINYNSVESL